MTVSTVFLVARFVFVVPFVVIGVNELGSGEPVRRFWGAVGLVGSASVAIGVWGDIGALVLGVQAIGTVVAAPTRRAETTLRAIGLAGGALVVFAVYVAIGDAIDWTVTDPAILLDLR